MECREIAIQTDVQIGTSTWIVTLENDQRQHGQHKQQAVDRSDQPARAAPEYPSAEQGVTKSEGLEDVYDDCLQMDCIECDEDSDFKHPD